MRLAFECPTSLLEFVQPMADFDWILAHLVLQDEKYAHFYAESFRFKVLDNSVNELLNPVSLKDLVTAAKIVSPNVVVSPDILGDSVRTLDSLKEIQKYFSVDEILPVLQGKTLNGIVGCSGLIKSLGYNKVAVPYDIGCERFDSLQHMAFMRKAVISQILDMFEEIHLLGLTTLEELVFYKGVTQIKSLDTGSPVLHGLKGIEYGKGDLIPKTIPTVIRMDNTTPSISALDLIRYNIKFLRSLTSD